MKDKMCRKRKNKRLEPMNITYNDSVCKGTWIVVNTVGCGYDPIRSNERCPAYMISVFTERDLPWPRMWGCIYTVHHSCGLERTPTTTCAKVSYCQGFPNEYAVMRQDLEVGRDKGS